MTDNCMNTVEKVREEAADILACALLDMILADNDHEREFSPGRTAPQEIEEQPACH
jgi:hypothetical protein